MLRPVLIAAFAGLALAACDPVGMTPAAALAPATMAATPAPAAGGFDGLLNSTRAGAGLPGAVADARLGAVAQAFAQDMVSRDFFSHTGPDGATVASRAAQAGYGSCASAENIAFGNASVTDAFATWMTSPLHRANILFGGAPRYGVGFAGGKSVLIVVRC